MTKSKDEPTDSCIWSCLKCESTFEHSDFVDHLEKIHGIDPKTTKGSKRMTLHIDGEKTYTTYYQWTIGELTFSQSITCARWGMNKALWAE